MTILRNKNTQSTKMNYHLKSLFCLSFGILLTIVGTTLSLFWTSLFDYILHSQLTLTPNSRSFELWENTPIPIYLDFYMFNWTNPEGAKNPDVVPNFVEMGPYRFREIKERTNLTWNSNGTITFNIVRRWYFVPEQSNGSLQDEITTLNAVSLTATYLSRNWNYLMQKGVSFSLAAIVKQIHVQRTVGELLFDGYSDNLFQMARSMPSMQGIKIPNFEKFGWFYGRNNSADYQGVFNMETGENDSSMFGVLKEWNYVNKTEYYPQNCGLINGSAGEFFPINRKKDSISLFSSDICRSVTFDFEEETQVHNITGYKYTGGARMMDNGTIYPENKCFCNGECVPSGVMNVSECRFGAPGFVSFPHFYYADPYYRELVSGMQPDKEKHSFSLTLEPKTGIPLQVNARLQLNLLMQPTPHISLYQNVRRAFMPILWFEQSVTVPSDMAGEIQMLLEIPSIGFYTNLVLALIGSVIVLVVITHFYLKKRSEGETFLPNICSHKKLAKTKEITKQTEKGPISMCVYTR